MKGIGDEELNGQGQKQCNLFLTAAEVEAL